MRIFLRIPLKNLESDIDISEVIESVVQGSAYYTHYEYQLLMSQMARGNFPIFFRYTSGEILWYWEDMLWNGKIRA